MKITIELSADEAVALRRLAYETGEELEEAARTGLREFLIGTGMLEMIEGDNDNEVSQT
ncbi:hypothetical protein GR158_12145 [Shinella sp. AETb1-6]|uniref:hypothetical protein n=1 Tax=Shinella sp. AETb1-6 TaxID=2692210 RepID=UPI00136B4B1F|nr:hypothetical protein [Shinella sp. AETb1-6]MXN51873.1 hypothetical protein [Shinella sp. AETb1-6]